MAPGQGRKKSAHYRPEKFQRALGAHCRKLRKSKGFSVDRLALESEGMSPNAVMRLERGDAVTTATLYRYARVLGVKVSKLFDFSFDDEDDA